MDDIILFPQISHGDMVEITKAKLSDLEKRLMAIGYDVRIADGVAELIAEMSSEKRFGVRHTLRLIATKIENPLSALVIGSDENEKYRPIVVAAENGEISVRYKDTITSTMS